MFLVNKFKAFLGQSRRNKVGEKRHRESDDDDDDEVTDCLQTPPSKRARHIQVKQGATSSSSPVFHKVNEGLLLLKRWSDKYLWKYVVSGEVEDEEEQENVNSDPDYDADMKSQFKQPSCPPPSQWSVARHRVQTTSLNIKHNVQNPSVPVEKGKPNKEWKKSFASITTPSIQTSTPLPHRPTWDVDKLERTFQGKDHDSYYGKTYDANKYKDKSFSWKPSSQLSFTIGQYHQDTSLSSSSKTMGKVRVGMARSGLEKRKKMGSRYQTTAEETVRLQERDRYKQLLAQHTTVDTSSAAYDFSQSTVSHPASSLFITAEERAHERPTPSRILDGSILSSHSSLLPSSTPARPYTCPPSPTLYSTPVVKVVASPRKKQDQATSHVQDVRLFSNPGPFEVPKVSERSYISSRPSYQVKKVAPVFEGDWIKKWKDVLSPESLARDREKAREERKLADIKAREQEELKAVEDVVKERIRRKEAGLPEEESEVSEEEEEEEEDASFPLLTDEMEQQVDKALAPGNPDEPLVDGFRITLKRSDVATLGNLNWLNDEVINFYFSLLVARSERPDSLKVYAFNSFFYPKLIKTGYATLRRWTKKVDIFTMDLVFVPIHLGMHWCLAAFDFRKKTITYYDSLKGSNHQCLNALRNYLCEESKDKKKQPFDLTGWTDSCPKDIPEQLNGCDCGVFTCKYAEYLSRGVPLTFSQQHMPYFRRRMIYEMLNKELM